MNYTSIDNRNETTANFTNLSIQYPKKRSLVAQWVMVDGKLVCMWVKD